MVEMPELEIAPDAEPVEVPFLFRAPVSANWSETITVDVEGGEPVTAHVVCGAVPTLAVEGEVLVMSRGEQGPFSLVLRHVDGGPAWVVAVQSTTGRLEVLGGKGLLQPGGELTVQVQLPGGARADRDGFRETLEIILLEGQRYRSVELSFPIVVQTPPRLELSAIHLDFGDVLPGRSRRQSLTLKNGGEGVLKVRQVALLENDGRWQLDLQDQPPFDIAGGNAPSIGLVLKEGPGGSFRAKLLVATNDPYQPEQTVALQAHVVETPQVSPAYVGIDFGTTHSCICVARPGQDAKTLELDDTQTGEDRFTMPSAVYWPKPPVAGNLRDCIVGRPALRAAEDPSNEDAVALSIKRKMGKRDTKRYLGVPLAPHEVAARVIRYMVDKAEDYLGAIVEKAVVTVPANYTPPQVRATVEACRLAGLEAEVVRSHMMDEPVGAAVDYLTELDEYKMMEMGLGPDFHALVYDFGGGTLDVSIIRYTYNGYRRSLKVVATKGDNFMGGDDLTELLREHLRRTAEATLQQNHGLRTRLLADPPDNRPPGLNAADQAIHQVNYTLLRNAAEAMKRKLSDEFEASGRVELRFMAGSRQHSDFMEFKIARRDYEKLIRERMESTGRLVERALTAAKLRPGDIQLILMVGKSSRTPLVGNLLEEWFRRDPVLHPEPKACVARGAYKKGEMDSLPGEEETDLVRELDRTNCRYGIISGTWRGKMFRTAIPEGVPFVATGSYPPPGTPLTAVPGVPVIVALNRGENDLYKDNEEIVELGQVMVDGQPGGPQVALEIEIQVEDHRNIHVQLRVDGKETKLARFEEY